MGKWNSRYLPRKKHRHREYVDPPSSPYNPHSYPSVEDSNLPSWEIEFCKSLRVPWRKLVASKKYIYCYPTVLNWDDSACKEALDDAKQRFWAMTNGILHDNPLPHPDMYIDGIDWDPYLDPELMEDLDGQFFNPDDEQKVDKLETITEEVGCSQTVENPWERNHVQGTGSIKDLAQGWNKWDDSVHLRKENPWEQGADQLVDISKNNASRNGNASGGWNQWCDSTWPSSVFENKWGDSRHNDGQGVPARLEGWGHAESNSCGWNHWNPNYQNVGSFTNNGNSWGNKFFNGPKDRGLTHDSNRPWDWRDSNESTYWDTGRSKRGGRSFRDGCRKRESSIPYTSKCKSSRSHVQNYGNWSSGVNL